MGVFEQFPYTNYHDLNDAWVLKTIKEASESVQDLVEWKAQHEAEYQELKTFMDNINAGNFPESMYDSMREWLEINAIDIVGSMVKHVYFGLNDAGYFVVNIPENWRDVVFYTTGLDITTALQPEYGHLVLVY